MVSVGDGVAAVRRTSAGHLHVPTDTSGHSGPLNISMEHNLSKRQRAESVSCA